MAAMTASGTLAT